MNRAAHSPCYAPLTPIISQDIKSKIDSRFKITLKRKWAVRKGKRSAMIYPHTFPRLAILLCYLYVCQEDVAPSLVVCSRKRVYSC